MKEISHIGKIININGNTASVLITQSSACAGCHANEICNAADKKEKIIEAIINNSDNFKINDTVNIIGKQKDMYKAILLAYVVPMLQIVIIMVICTNLIKFSEILSAFISLISLTLYYLILWLFKDHLKSVFVFRIKNI